MLKAIKKVLADYQSKQAQKRRINHNWQQANEMIKAIEEKRGY